ncbi:MAG: nodulation protein NfeD [Chloroflexota bacterium]
MSRLLAICLIGLLGLGLAATARAQDRRGAVHIAEIRGVINPLTAQYLDRILDDAKARGAQLVVLKLDTPGGLDSSMREMIQDILASPVPVAVYVTPSGARAASAGLFLLIAGHVAAMTPSTNTGAAHPVGLGGDTDEVMTSKVVNDAAATIRALAEQRGRNAEWAERAVRESESITETEALQLNVIDVVARNLDDLLAQIDGWTIQTAEGEVVLDLAGAPRREVSMNLPERFMHMLTDPNLAFILLTVGTIGIIAELYNPGALFPGITGVIALILAFLALGNLPTNWAGVALVALAVVLFIAELNTEGTGILGVGAVVAFLLGGLILFRPIRPGSPALPDMHVDTWLIGATTLAMAGFVLVVMAKVARARQAPPLTGYEHYIGQIASVRQALRPTGRVWFEGQSWFAQTESGVEVAEGQSVRVVGLDGLTLIVEPLEEDTMTRSGR